MMLVRTLIDCDKRYREPALPQGLRELHDGDCTFVDLDIRRDFHRDRHASLLEWIVFRWKRRGGTSIRSRYKGARPTTPGVVAPGRFNHVND